MEDDHGRQLNLFYDTTRRLIRLEGPDGVAIQFAYNAAGYLARVTYADSTFVEYLYDEPPHSASTTTTGLLTGTVDESGQRATTTSYLYSGWAQGTTEGEGANSEAAVYYPGPYGVPQHATVTLAGGSKRKVEFVSQRGRVVPARVTESCAECQGRVTEYSYAPSGLIAAITRNGVSTTYRYDNDLRLIEMTEAVGTTAARTRRFEWDGNSSLRVKSRSVLDAAGRLISQDQYQYDGFGNLVRHQAGTSVAQHRVTTYAYCQAIQDACVSFGQLLSVDGPLAGQGDAISYIYYADDAPGCADGLGCRYRRGDLWRVVDALGARREIDTYDGAGRILSELDRNGVATAYSYNVRGWLSSITVGAAEGQAGRSHVLKYHPNGLLREITAPDGGIIVFTYDAAKRLTRVSDGDGATISYELDAAGNRTSESVKDAAGTLRRALTRAFDPYGQVKTESAGTWSSGTATYDANGNAIGSTDALGRSSVKGYDPLQRLAESIGDSGGIAAHTAFSYDAADNLTAITDPKGLVTSYAYNAFGELEVQSSPDTGVTQVTYDAAGNIATRTDARGITATYAYDGPNRPLATSYPDAANNIGYTYDVAPSVCAIGEAFGVGRLSTMADASGQTSYCYNRFGEVVRKVQQTNGVNLTIRYAYTAAGRLAAVTYPDGMSVDYLRDVQGRISEIGVTSPGGNRQVLITGVTYLPFGPSTGWRYGKGRTLTRTFDLDYRPTGVVDSEQSLKLSIGYDAVGSLVDLNSGNQRAKLDYDALGRLIAFKDGSSGVAIEAYTYDKTGNRTSLTTAAGTSAYTYPTDSHRLAAVAGVPRTYDAAGNTITIAGSRQFAYDDTNRMSAVESGGAAVRHFGYNGKGERVHSFLGNDNTYALYDEAGHWLGDYGVGGAPIQQAIWMDDLPVGLQTATVGALSYVEPDHLGSPRVVVDPIDDTVVWKWAMEGEAFGATAPDRDPDADSVGFKLDMRTPGQRYDSNTGLNYNYYRDYDASSGRYVQSDPIGLSGGMSTYVYVGGNPLNNVDPLGLAGGPLAGYKPALGPIIIKTPTSKIPWIERFVSSLIVGKLSLGSTSVNEYGQLVPKASSLIGRASVAYALMDSTVMDCAELDCNANGIGDFLERNPNSCPAPGAGMLIVQGEKVGLP